MDLGEVWKMEKTNEKQYVLIHVFFYEPHPMLYPHKCPTYFSTLAETPPQCVGLRAIFGRGLLGRNRRWDCEGDHDLMLYPQG